MKAPLFYLIEKLFDHENLAWVNKLHELPVAQQFELIRREWNNFDHLAIQSPTGSGKSLALPALLSGNGMVEGQILVVQPRRVAARLLAKRLAALLGAMVGDEVGYQVRFDSKVSNKTKIIYLTDGVLMRKLFDDRTLSRVGLIIFDEFHERSIQSDFSLALVRKLSLSTRPSLKCIITSATLDLDKTERYMPNCGKVRLESRSYAVQIKHRARSIEEPIWDQVARELKKIVSIKHGNLLIFMDGAFEINRMVRKIRAMPIARDFEVFPLFGEMSLADQDRAIEFAGRRKIIVSTNIAETSLTVDGVSLVIDTGMAKKASFDPMRGLNVLLSQPICKSSADQRAGRAGRTSDGYCLRLWSHAQHQSKEEFDRPEIQRLDLSELYLNLLSIGERVDTLVWFDEPPETSIDRALVTLTTLGAIKKRGQISSHGMELSRIPLHPKLGNALLHASKADCLSAVALIIALSEERSPFDSRRLSEFSMPKGRDSSIDLEESDLLALLVAYEKARALRFETNECRQLGIHGLRFREAEKVAEKLCAQIGQTYEFELPQYEALVRVLVSSFPENTARLRNRGTSLYETLSGKTVRLPRYSLSRKSEWVFGMSILEKTIKGSIGLEMTWVTPLSLPMVEDFFQGQITREDKVVLDLDTRKVVRRKFDRLGSQVFNQSESGQVSETDRAKAYASAIESGDLSLKGWGSKVEAYLARALFVSENFPHYGISPLDTSMKLLLLEEICYANKTWKQIRNAEVLPHVQAIYSDEQSKWIDALAPVSLDLGNGKKPYPLRYEKEAVFLTAPLQDLYDLATHPSIGDGEFLVAIEILAPNGRVVQVTEDLPGFWSGSYQEVKKDLAGRYPKHEWR